MGARRATGVWLILLGIAAGAVPHDGDRSVERLGKDLIDLDGQVASLESIGTIGGVSEDGCEIFGDFSRDIRSLSPLRYRGNLYRIKADAILHEIRMELQLAIDAPVDLFFEVHRTRTIPVEDPPIYVRVMPEVEVLALGDGSVTLFSTGQLIDPPTGQIGLRLEAGWDYSIAVSWESIDVNYGRNSVRTPFGFLHGKVLGRVLRSIAPPIDDELTSVGLESGPTSGAYSMQLCFEPVTGACCDGTMGCEARLEVDCTAVGSHFFGQRTTCDETVCQPGACCMPCGECSNDFIPAACEAVGGAMQWPGVACPANAADLCPKLTGACCEAGVCTPDVCIDECDDIGGIFGGIFRGVGSECEPNICIGACCRDANFGKDLPCVEVTQSFCEDPQVDGGTYRGDGTTCSTLAPADACGGACCFTIGGVGGCQNVATRAECSVGAGVEDPNYLGDGTSCFNNACPATAPGSCCLFESTCMDTDVDTCATLEGDFVLASDPEGDCLTRSCAVAACCFPDGSCAEDLTATGCMNRGGTSQPSGTTCQVAMCVAPTGACCGLAAGVCTDNMTEADCEDADGVYLGDGSDCLSAATDCPGFGACCRPEGTCFSNLTVAECNTIGGDLNAVALCADIFLDCEQRGACCAITGLCLFVTVAECDEVDGVFNADARCDFANVCPSGACCVGETCLQRTRDGCMKAGSVGAPSDYRGDGTTCDERVCGDVEGACCLPNGISCVTLLPQDCLDVPFEGVFQGAGKECDETICKAGACCLSAGDCDDDVLPTRCAERGGMFETAFRCIQGACDPRGACCVNDDTCTEALPKRQCDNLGGTLTSDALCDELDPLCEPTGSCCQRDGTCMDDVFVSVCQAGDNTRFVQGESCDQATCPPFGACCMAGSCEPNITEDDCRLGGGVYQGDASDCTAGLCALGACCPVDGDCVDGAVASECTATEDRFTEGAACVNVPCPPRGACCLDGTCSIRTLFQCTGAGGDFGGVGTLCDTADRCLIGACCFEFTACDNTLTRQQCERVIPNAGTGLFGGAGSTCSTDLCKVGRCCSATAVCRERTLITDCDDPADFRETSCQIPCEGRGACCVPGDETCRIMTQTACTEEFGFYGGDGSTCNPADLCSEGSCCLPSGNCSERSQLLCNLGSGNFTTGGALCADTDCARGACCVPGDEACRIMTPTECTEEEFGFYGGDGSTCDPADLCSDGACCLPSGTCSERSRLLCELTSGTFKNVGSLCTNLDCSISIVSSLPPSCAIDAAQPSEPDGSATTGPTFEVTFNSSAAGLGPEHFSIVFRPVPAIGPGILDVLPGGDANTVVVRLNGPPVPGRWTCLVHNDSGTETCLGGLPGDVGGSGTSEPADVQAVIDCVSGAAACQLWQCDADRSGRCGPSDVLRVIDLLGGGEAFTRWAGVSLTAPCPTMGP